MARDLQSHLLRLAQILKVVDCHARGSEGCESAHLQESTSGRADIDVDKRGRCRCALFRLR